MKTEVILFDLGGVLVELSGMPTVLEWSALDENELWYKWLHSPAVRKFESGQGDADEFASEIIRELGLKTNEAEFLTEFSRWPKGLFDGGIELLRELREITTIACLSNTNFLHWERFRTETELLELFHTTLASHETGLLKPDLVTYTQAVEKLGVKPEAILFLDDNQINIDAALTIGIQAKLTKGAHQAKQHIQSIGLLD